MDNICINQAQSARLYLGCKHASSRKKQNSRGKMQDGKELRSFIVR